MRLPYGRVILPRRNDKSPRGNGKSPRGNDKSPRGNGKLPHGNAKIQAEMGLNRVKWYFRVVYSLNKWFFGVSVGI